MKTKKEIVDNWLPRYTGLDLESFGQYILICNFHNYIEKFAQMHEVEIVGSGKPMQCATANGITIINFGMGSASAATCMDLLSAIGPKAVLFLGKCGGLKRKNEVGDLVLPIAAIRGDGTSNDYFPPEVPALPAFLIVLLRAAFAPFARRGHTTPGPPTTMWVTDAIDEARKRRRALTGSVARTLITRPQAKAAIYRGRTVIRISWQWTTAKLAARSARRSVFPHLQQ